MKTVELDGWVYGDNDSSVILTLYTADGTAYDFTGASAVVLVCWKSGARNPDDQVEVSGAVYGTATNGQIRFTGIAAAVSQPAIPGASEYWRAIPKWTKSATTRYARTEFRFPILRFS